MCGIAGVVDRRGVDEPGAVGRQLALLEHRGPDARGVHARPTAVVGQTRLAVVDLVTGDPVVTNEDGSVAALLNGEIYNYAALRDELRGAGHRLATSGDTEVLAHLAEGLGPAALARRLDGMFAFAVWDERRARLALGRDRLGKKPLYYWVGDGGRLVFASEIKAVLAHPLVPRRPAPEAVPAYLTFGYVPTPHTFFAGVRSLPPGHVLVLEPDGPPRVERYWEPRAPGAGGVGRSELSAPEAARAVRAGLRAAVARRLTADVPVGAFLSGGVDSSAVVGTMAELSPRPVRTFTVGFDAPGGFDERVHARRVARRFGTDHVELVVTPDAVELVERLVWHHDQPFGDSSAIATFMLAELTRPHVTVALSGDGGDELFAGYRRFAAGLAADRFGRAIGPIGPALTRALSALPPGSPGRGAGVLRRFLTSARLGLPDAYLAWVTLLPAELRGDEGGGEWGLDHHREIWRRSAGAHALDRLLDLNLRTYLLDDLLVKMDRMSMAHGLEVRSPFLDRELLELALSLPPEAKLRGFSRKRVLRAAVRDLLPREVLHRRKQGFAVPLDRWLRRDLRGYVTSMLGTPTARVRRHLAPGALDRLLAEQDRGAAAHGQALWTLLSLEVFLRREGW